MTLKLRLEHKQVQRLILAPALQQAIKLLPLTNLELIEIIDSELSQNPMLECEEETAENNIAEKTEGKEKDKEGKEKEKLETREGQEEESSMESQGEAEDSGFESYFQEYFDDGFRPYFSEKKEALSLENIVSKRWLSDCFSGRDFKNMRCLCREDK
jgi:RNA polymerase sigma-54 factor